MTIKEVKQHWIITCDGCGTQVTQTGTHRPPGWAVLTLEQAAEDFQGAEVADGSVKAMFCKQCRSKIVNAINTAYAEIISMRKDSHG